MDEFTSDVFLFTYVLHLEIQSDFYFSVVSNSSVWLKALQIWFASLQVVLGESPMCNWIGSL